MEKKQFKAESKRLMELMIHSIYTHKEIFLRELISNASDAIDKLYYEALTNEDLTFNKDDYYIHLSADKEARTLTIEDTGIGMNREELENNLGTIAQSGSLAFKEGLEKEEGFDIIGQFGVGFYSAFMVADKVSVLTKRLGEDQAYLWESEGVEGYTITGAQKDKSGTKITIRLKENTEDENYDEYLEPYYLRSLVKKYSDFISYPIKTEVEKSRLKEGSEDEYEEYTEVQTLNSMVPLWRKNKNELKDEDYENFYHEKHYGFDKPVSHLHLHVDGMIRYDSVLFLPSKTPYDFYTPDYEKGLELYSSGVLIMQKCADLLPDYFSFVKGMVDSEDLSLNISRELLQHDRQLKAIAKNIKGKIKGELENLLKNEREKYEAFFKEFGRQLKYGVYSDFGSNKETLQDLLLFTSSFEDKLSTLAEYVGRMKEDQKYIFYATGSSLTKLKKLPQAELLLDKGYEILYLTDDVDEFALKMMANYEEKEFKNISSKDLGLDDDEVKEEELNEEEKSLFVSMKEVLGDKVSEIKATNRLKTHPVFLSAGGDISIEMEKVLSNMPGNPGMKAEKVLEINRNHEIFSKLLKFKDDEAMLKLYTNLLYQQARLIEGLEIEDPVEFTNDICKLM
ncbi:MAG: molecular chaperone HtpG [Filifactor alocis]|nr:molecular chaperone HtpG [Filifactor alocis]